MKKYIVRIRELYSTHIAEANKEARFLVLLSFILTFVIARSIVYGIQYHLLPQQFVQLHMIHIHHLVFGIFLLLIAGLVRSIHTSKTGLQLTSILYGIGAALTLDEFSLWVRLNPDAYFGMEGRISIDAVIIFTLLLIAMVWFEPFWSSVFDSTVHIFLFKKNVWYGRIKRMLFRYKKHKVLIVLGVSLWAFLIGEVLSYYLCSQFIPSVSHSIARNEKPIPKAVCSPTSIPPIPATKVVAVTAQSEATSSASKRDFCMHVPVLMYHHIEPWSAAIAKKHTSLAVDSEIFDKQMGYLATHGYKTISADELIQALLTHVSLPPKSIVLTFDDAYLDNYLYMYPILKKYGLVGNIAVPTGLLGQHAATNDYFTWDQLKEMVSSGTIFAVNHTWSHYPVGTGSLDKNRFEVDTPKQQLESYLDRKSETFVYPYGSFKPWVFALLQKDGYQGAFTTNPGTLECQSFIMNLPRVRIGNAPISAFGI